MTSREPLDDDEAKDLDGADEADDDEARVELIARSMAEGRWSQRMAADLAKRWEVSVWKVRRYSATASHRLRAALDADELAATLVGRLERTYKAAFDAGDYRGAAAALKLLADVAGLGGGKGKGLVLERPRGPLDGLPKDFRELAERDELLAFVSIHQRRPSPSQRAELLAGTRHPGDTCGHSACPYCNRPAAQPH